MTPIEIIRGLADEIEPLYEARLEELKQLWAEVDAVAGDTGVGFRGPSFLSGPEDYFAANGAPGVEGRRLYSWIVTTHPERNFFGLYLRVCTQADGEDMISYMSSVPRGVEVRALRALHDFICEYYGELKTALGLMECDPNEERRNEQDSRAANEEVPGGADEGA